MMTDSDLLAMIKSTGGQLVRHHGGEFWANFDDDYQSVVDGMVESSGPALTARTSDVRDLPKEVTLEVTPRPDIALPGGQFRLKRPERNGGITVLLLKL